MVHTDVTVTRTRQLFDGAFEHFKFLLWRRQFIRIDPPLGHEAFRQVGVVEYGQAIRL